MIIEIRRNRFLLGWIIAGLVVYPFTAFLAGVLINLLAIIFALIGFDFYFYMDNFLDVSITSLLGLAFLGAVTGLAVSELQTYVFRHNLFWTADYWRRMSVLGGLIGGIALSIAYGGETPLEEALINFGTMPLYIGFVSLFQYFALRRATRWASLWLLANIVGGFAFSRLFGMNGISDDFLRFMSFFVQSSMTGVVILHLFEHHAYRPVVPKELQGTGLDPARVKSVWDEAV